MLLAPLYERALEQMHLTPGFHVIAGRPEEQDDSENSTIYITGLTEKAKVEEMAEFFKHVGPIRVSKHH